MLHQQNWLWPVHPACHTDELGGNYTSKILLTFRVSVANSSIKWIVVRTNFFNNALPKKKIIRYVKPVGLVYLKKDPQPIHSKPQLVSQDYCSCSTRDMVQ
jgi:hypothetical protein